MLNLHLCCFWGSLEPQRQIPDGPAWTSWAQRSPQSPLQHYSCQIQFCLLLFPQQQLALQCGCACCAGQWCHVADCPLFAAGFHRCYSTAFCIQKAILLLSVFLFRSYRLLMQDHSGKCQVILNLPGSGEGERKQCAP